MDSSTRRARVAWAAMAFVAATSAASTIHAQPAPNPINPFQCYEIKPRQFQAVPGVNVVDAFGAHVARVRFPHRLCAPAVVPPIIRARAAVDYLNGEHLIGHVVTSDNVKVKDQVVVTALGAVTLDVWRPDLLLVPTLKSLVDTPPALPNPIIDHFQCYKVKRSQGSDPFTVVRDYPVEDQFGATTVDIMRPVRLCMPANKNDEDPTAPGHPNHLLCYRTRNSRFGTVQTYTNSQFGPERPTLIHRRELCLPALRNPPPTTTTSTTVPTTTTTIVTTTTTTTTPSSTIPSTSTTFPTSTTVPPSTTTTTTFPTSTTFPSSTTVPTSTTTTTTVTP